MCLRIEVSFPQHYFVLGDRNWKMGERIQVGQGHESDKSGLPKRLVN